MLEKQHDLVMLNETINSTTIGARPFGSQQIHFDLSIPVSMKRGTHLLLGLLFNLKSGKGSLLPFLVPLFGPDSWADVGGLHPEGLASRTISGLLQTKEPFVVPIPTVTGLVGRRETGISGGGTGGLELVEHGALFLVHTGGGLRKDFVEARHGQFGGL